MNLFTLNQLPLFTDDFFFTFTDNLNVKDAIVVFNPMDSLIVSPVFLRSRKTLEEHIRYIHENNIKKAVVIGNSIDYLKSCPDLEYLHIIPSVSAEDFDYSPIYDLPKLKYLQCETKYGMQEEKIAIIDYSRVADVKRLVIHGAHGHLNVNTVKSVVSLNYDFGYPGTGTLRNSFCGESLASFSISQSPIKSLDGIESAQNLRRLDLSYNRRLTDISNLRYLRETLACLTIDTCGKIYDFSVLSELKELEYLTLKGSNLLPNVLFLRNLPKLKYLHITMNVEDGDLSMCESIPYVKIKNRKHYSHKDEDMLQNYTDPDEAYPFH